MQLPRVFSFLPVKVYAIDADTQQPLDPNVGRRTHVTYYDIKKDKSGKKSVIAHRSPAPSAHGGSAKAEEVRLAHPCDALQFGLAADVYV